MVTPSQSTGSGKPGVSEETSQIDFNLPTGAKIRGRVPLQLERHALREDMADVRLPNGVVIDIGWYPQWDPSGEFVVCVFKGDWDNLLESEWCTTDVEALKSKVESLARSYSAPSNSSSQ